MGGWCCGIAGQTRFPFKKLSSDEKNPNEFGGSLRWSIHVDEKETSLVKIKFCGGTVADEIQISFKWMSIIISGNVHEQHSR
jgi:hypothetical protein